MKKIGSHLQMKQSFQPLKSKESSVDVSSKLHHGAPLLNLGIGSLVQIPSSEAVNPLRYGTIKWIGTLPNVTGRVAGIVMVRFNLLTHFCYSY